MKKILIIFSGEFHIDEGAKHRLNSFINSYVSRDYEVTVLFFFKDHWKYLLQRGKYLNVQARWILFPYILPISKSFFLANILTWYIELITGLVIFLKSFDIIQAEIRGCSLKYAHRKQLKIVDFHGDSASESYFVKKKDWLRDWNYRDQKKSIELADRCICVSEKLKKQLEKNTGKDISHWNIISCGVDLERFNKAKRIEKKSLSDRIVLGYSGGLQSWQNIRQIIQIVNKLYDLDHRIFFMLYTNHSTDSIHEDLAKLGKDNYAIYSLSSSEIPSYLKILDAGFLLRDDLILNEISSPTKICEYLASGVPLICTRYSGDYERSVKHSSNGFILNDVIPTERENLNLLTFLHGVKRDRKKVSELCYDAVKNRTFENEFTTFIKSLS